MNLFIFPGQGAQYAGIGQDLYDQHQIVKDTYSEASDALGFDIAKLSFQADDAEITLTKNTQPVLVTHHIACLRAFNALTGQTATPAMTAGHSLGEYSALVAGDRLAFADALRLVRKRGELMGELGRGEMMALTVGVDEAQSIAEQHYCAIAAENLADQTVVGGSREDLSSLESAFAEAFPRKRAIRLKTEGAFHTYYMVEAAIQFREALAAVEFTQADVQVLANVSGGVHGTSAESVRSKLFYQLFNPVLWHKNLLTAYDAGITDIIEFGGGLGSEGAPASERKPNLAGMVKKAYRGQDRKVNYQAIINQATLEAAAS